MWMPIMQTFDADLHIHSPYSIAVSQNLNLDTMFDTASKKGIQILGTGDITQPNWRSYLKEKLEHERGIYKYKSLYFILQTELEDNESIHHVVFLPDFASADRLQEILDPYVKDIKGRWAGRPHVNKSPAEIVDLVESVGGICGPSHAFTPFKSIFRQGKYRNLADAYGGAEKKVAFLELGLSADTFLADRMSCLKDITFLSNSDAHSEGPQSLGREFNRISCESPTFDEIKKAMFREKGRKVVLNVGLEPRLGKYYIMFCKNCRRRVKRSFSNATPSNALNDLFGLGKATFDADFITFTFSQPKNELDFLRQVGSNRLLCPACQQEKKKQQETEKGQKSTSSKGSSSKLSLGVSERINEIADLPEPLSPDHRPRYLDIVPLIEILRKQQGVKNQKAKKLVELYDRLISTIGSEFQILVDKPIEELNQFNDGKLGLIVQAFREQKIQYIPGGGGTFGEISIDEFDG
jgi:uncharacterized protein (TIGR00375 family)